MTKILEAKNLVKTYGNDSDIKTKALNDISLAINEGEFVGIMGPSGSGKSTLANILSGIMKPTSGSVIIKGTEIEKMNAYDMALFRRQKLGFVFQEFNLLDNLTIKENVMLPLIMDKTKKEVMEEKTAKLLHYFEITEIAHKFPYQVSGGQMQRAAVLRALINDPLIVFADEPTGNLDSKSSRNVMELFSKVNKENKTTILMVTHDPFAASFCNKVIFIKDGMIDFSITKEKDRKAFFDQILDCQAVIGGEKNDL